MVKTFELILDEQLHNKIMAAAKENNVCMHKYIIQVIENSLKKGE